VGRPQCLKLCAASPKLMYISIVNYSPWTRWPCNLHGGTPYRNNHPKAQLSACLHRCAHAAPGRGGHCTGSLGAHRVEMTIQRLNYQHVLPRLHHAHARAAPGRGGHCTGSLGAHRGARGQLGTAGGVGHHHGPHRHNAHRVRAR